MFAYVGHITQPIVNLTPDIFEIGKVPDGQKLLRRYLMEFSTLPFFVGRTDGTGMWSDAKRTKELQQRFVEAD